MSIIRSSKIDADGSSVIQVTGDTDLNRVRALPDIEVGPAGVSRIWQKEVSGPDLYGQTTFLVSDKAVDVLFP